MSAYSNLIPTLVDVGVDLGVSYTPDFEVIRRMALYDGSSADAQFKLQPPTTIKVEPGGMLHVCAVGNRILSIEIEATSVTSHDGILATSDSASNTMTVPLLELFHDMACHRLTQDYGVLRAFCKNELKLLTRGKITLKLTET